MSLSSARTFVIAFGSRVASCGVVCPSRDVTLADLAPTRLVGVPLEPESCSDDHRETWVTSSLGFRLDHLRDLFALCDKVDDGAGGAFVFNRVQYCPSKCEGGMNPTDPSA